jgi:hypothetical protein
MKNKRLKLVFFLAIALLGISALASVAISLDAPATFPTDI